MVGLTGSIISLLVIMSVGTQALAQTPPTAAGSDAEATQAAPPAQRKVWSEWLEREPAPLESEPEPQATWYGWQTLLVDALSIGTAVLGGTASMEGFWVGVGIFTIGSPVVHFAHLNFAEGGASIGMRLVAAGLFLWAASVLDEERAAVGPGLLGVIATAVVVTLDAVLLGWKEHPRKATSHAWITPWIDPKHGRAGLSYAVHY